MPLYEYECRDCRAEVELLVQGSSEPVCPECGGRSLTKLLSVVAAPGHDLSAGAAGEKPSRPCGPSCGCHPHG